MKACLASLERAAVFKWGMYDRDAFTHWTRGRVTQLRHAAHRMMPTLAQGTNSQQRAAPVHFITVQF
jgi:2-polyprenyl-6-methoxyphenol hydroxylase-like FAD-dependent oxidoreductase